MSKRDPELPPFARSWGMLYALVIGSLLLEIILFYWFMNYFS